MTQNILTQDRLKKLLRYSVTTGLFTWLEDRNNNAKKGDIAGCHHSSGYVIIYIDNKPYRAHRLVWLYLYGCFPYTNIHHKNHIRHDNRISNLRVVSAQENRKNASISKNNVSGVIGVYWHKLGKKWASNITVNRKTIHLGLFNSITDAVIARKIAEHEYGFHKNHGS